MEVADYQGLIRVGVQGLGEVGRLENRLNAVTALIRGLERSSVNVEQLAESSSRRVARAGSGVVRARQELADARKRRVRDASGRFAGADTAARRRAEANLRISEIGLRQEAQGLAELNRQRKRYAERLRRANQIRETTVPGYEGRKGALQGTMNKIATASRGNYLANLFQGRQREFTRGGGGRELPANLQQQARSIRAAWDIATAGGRENLQLMQRLATELAGVIRQQNELNRGAAGRSASFESGRRGQERITELSRMAGADPGRVRRLRSMATEAIAVGNTGDVAGAREAARRMNAAIGRYERELNAAARELRAAQARGGPRSPLRGGRFTLGSPAYLERLAGMGGPRESVKGRKDLVGSPAYLEEQQKQLQRAIRAGGPKESIKGRKDIVGSPAYYEEQQKQLARAIRAGGPRESVKGRKDLVGSPAYLEEQQKQQSQQLQRAIRAGGPRESVRGRRDLVGSPAYYEEQQKQLAKAIRAGGPRESIKGRKDVVGSPAYYEEQQKQLAKAIRAGGPRESIRGRKDIIGSPAYLEAQQKESDRIAQKRQRERERIARLRQISSPIRGTATMVGSPAYLEAQDKALTARQRIRRLGPASPIGGTKTMVDSPAYLAEQARQAARQQRQAGQQGFLRGNPRQAFGEGLIGGAFPLLFGQGVGASVGGFAGGFGGGMVGGMYGFGLSLIGTAIGGAVDSTVQSLKDLAASLKSPTDAIQALEKSGFRVGDSLKFQVEQLQAVGRAYDAQTLVLQEVEKRLGKGGVRELNALDTEQKRLGDQWSGIAGQLQSELLPALVGFTGAIADITAAAIGFSNLPGIKQVASVAVELFSPTLSPVGIARKAFGFVQERGRAIAATSAGNRRQLSPQERLADEKTRTEESRRVADQIQSAYREAFNLQRQAHDLQRDGAMLNRDMADYTYKKEREIFDLRQQVAEKQIENTRASSQNRIESGDLSARQTFAAATGLEQQILTNVREVVRTRKEGEADIEQSRSRLELAMAKLNRDVEDYKRTNAREIEDIERRKLSYARSVEDYKKSVADYVRDRTREAADLWKQAMAQGAVGAAGGGAGAGGGGAIGGTKLSQLIGARESYGGNYGAFNRGGTNAGHTAFGSGVDPNLVNMTIAEIQRRQGNQQLHAVGKYQIIGSTLRSLMQGRYGATGVSPADRFTPDVQERLGAALARNRVQGRSVEAGMAGLRQEWIGLQYVSDAKLREAVIELQGGATMQGRGAAQIGSIPAPQFNPTPIGPTPSAAPFNAANLAASLQLQGGTKEAQRILEDQIKLKQKGIELSQVEQILQSNQLPQLQQQGAALKLQIAARQKILDLSDQDAAIADLEAEAKARLAQIEKDRANALAKVRKQYKNDPVSIKQVNTQSDLAVKIAQDEEKQRRANLDLQNKLQSQDQIRTQILQGQEELAMARVEAAAMERGELEASNVELLKASTLYKQADEAQRAKWEALTGETRELRKQSELRKRLNEMQQEMRFTGAGLRAGFIGAGGQAYEQGLKESKGNVDIAKQYAKQAMLREDQQLVWDNLTKSITAASDAISGGLTTGLVDILSSINDTKDGKRVNIGKKFSELGRETFGGVARSFAEPAQQQLSSVLQRQLASVLGGPQGPLVKLFGAGAEVAGPQSLGSAAMAASGSLWGFNSALLAVGASLQGIAAQSAFTGALSGAGGFGAAFTNSIPGVLNGFGGGANILNSIMPGISFGGFLANGGNTRPGEAYVVGENEPEFFFPGVSGRVVPKSDMEKAANLRAANSKSDTIDVSYTVTEQQGQRFVTEEQFRRSNAALLQRSQAATYAGMRNNSGIRDYVGI